MSFLKWKEISSSRSKVGREVNNVREHQKQSKIAEEMSGIQAEKLFKPITSVLKEPIERKKQLKHAPTGVPDYGLIDDENEVQPEAVKQIPPVLPPYSPMPPLASSEGSSKESESDDSLEPDDEEFHEMFESAPPAYDEPDVPDYEILDEDKVNERLDHYGLVNYEKLQEIPSGEAREQMLSKNIDVATKRQRQLRGYKTHITKQLSRGEIGEAEAQYRRKDIDDTRNILKDYITFNKNQLKVTKGSGLKKGGGYPMLFNDPNQLAKKLETIVGSIAAGNNSVDLRNTGVAILDFLLRNSIISNSHYKKIYKKYFVA